MHIMLDLETLSSQSNAAVLSIGAVAFRFRSDMLYTEANKHFYAVLDTDEQTSAHERHISRNTMVWWGEQSSEAKAVFNEEAQSTRDVLLRFVSFCASNGPLEGMWGNGSDFDNIILGSLYDAYGIKRPWPHSKNRCYRTLKNLPGVECIDLPMRTGTYHNALDDAIHQTRCVDKINYELKLGF